MSTTAPQQISGAILSGSSEPEKPKTVRSHAKWWWWLIDPSFAKEYSKVDEHISVLPRPSGYQRTSVENGVKKRMIYVAIQLTSNGIRRIRRNIPPSPKMAFPLTVKMVCGTEHTFDRPRDIPTVPVMCTGPKDAEIPMV